MPDQGLIPVLFCLLAMWRILTPVSSHPQHSHCKLVRCITFSSNRKNVKYTKTKTKNTGRRLEQAASKFFTILLPQDYL